MNKLKRVAFENREIYHQGFYLNDDSQEIDISSITNEAVLNTKFHEDILFNLNRVDNSTIFKVCNNIEPIGTIDCILKLRESGEMGNIIALNFASATTPGGGYLNGSTAQEESLCRASLLYSCLVSDMSMYNKNRANYSPLYSDRMMYSPNVPVIRNDNGELLDNYQLASFITSPAVNKKMASKLFISSDIVNEVMRTRIKKIIALAVKQNPSVLILGAFGCGVFGNSREDIFEIFEEVINEYVPLDSIKVIFAIRDNVSKR